MKKHHLLKLLCLLFFCLSIASCDKVECIDPDDFGNHPKMTISSKGKNSSMIPGTNFQAVDWEQKYTLNGNQVVMVVENTISQTVGTLSCDSNFDSNNTWIPIFGDIADTSQSTLATFDPVPPNPWCGGLDAYENIPVSNLPSKLYMGLGLYSSIGTKSPEKGSLECGLDRYSGSGRCLVHIGDTVNSCMSSRSPSSKNNICNTGFYSQHCPAGGVTFSPPSECGFGNCKLYMKILDRYYDDNTGQYTVAFKQGVDAASPGVIANFVSLVMERLCNGAQTVYEKIVHGSSFINYVRALLILYIIFVAIGFLMGFIQISNQELIIRIFKIALVMQIAASDASWSFFSKNFFYFFQNGVSELVSILFGQGATAVAATAKAGVSASTACIPNVAGFKAFDDIISVIFSYETSRKILSLLVGSLYGFIFIPILYILLVVILYTIVNALLVFIVSYLATSILIILAPIFLPFILFQLTRSFFDNWLKQLISYFIQPLIILAFAFFLITLLMNQLYYLFGYRVCWKQWGPDFPFGIKLFAWQADYSKDAMACMLTPNTIFDVTPQGDLVPVAYPGPAPCDASAANKSSSGNCDPYTCSQQRYVGFPYLNPMSEVDKSRIDELKNNELISLKDIALFVVIIWFMLRFGRIVPAIAKNLADAEFSGFTPFSAAGGMQNKLDSAAGKVLNYATGGRLAQARKTISGFKEKYQDMIGKPIEKIGAIPYLPEKYGLKGIRKVGQVVGLPVMGAIKAEQKVTAAFKGVAWKAKQAIKGRGGEENAKIPTVSAPGTLPPVTKAQGAAGPQAGEQMHAARSTVASPLPSSGAPPSGTSGEEAVVAVPSAATAQPSAAGETPPTGEASRPASQSEQERQQRSKKAIAELTEGYKDSGLFGTLPPVTTAQGAAGPQEGEQMHAARSTVASPLPSSGAAPSGTSGEEAVAAAPSAATAQPSAAGDTPPTGETAPKTASQSEQERQQRTTKDIAELTEVHKDSGLFEEKGQSVNEIATGEGAAAAQVPEEATVSEGSKPIKSIPQKAKVTPTSDGDGGDKNPERKIARKGGATSKE